MNSFPKLYCLRISLRKNSVKGNKNKNKPLELQQNKKPLSNEGNNGNQGVDRTMFLQGVSGGESISCLSKLVEIAYFP